MSEKRIYGAHKVGDTIYTAKKAEVVVIYEGADGRQMRLSKPITIPEAGKYLLDE